MTRTIAEGEKVVEAVRAHGRVFRVNTWFRYSGDQLYDSGFTAKECRQLVQSGMLGWPLTVTISGATGFAWKFYWSGRTDLSPQWTPPELDYDFWLGPAPYKPYHPHRVHGTFRGYWDYDGGGLGDMGQHYIDPVQDILGKDVPIAGGYTLGQVVPGKESICRLSFSQTGFHPLVTLYLLFLTSIKGFKL